MVSQHEGFRKKSPATVASSVVARARHMRDSVLKGMQQRARWGNPFGLVLLAASFLVAAALATMPALELWADRASWVVGWGLMIYLVMALVAAWPKSAARPPKPIAGADPDPGESPRSIRGTYPDGLTRREVEVLCLIAAGKANKEIAAHLSLSVPTVERHVANIYTKISAHGRVEAASYALRHGLCPSAPRPGQF